MNVDQLVDLGLNVVAAIAILVAGWVVAGWVERLVRSSTKRNERLDATLVSVLARIARWAVLAFTLIAVLDRFGVQTTSLVALLGAAGLAIGLALQGALSNVAAGVMILGLRPFRLGYGAVDLLVRVWTLPAEFLATRMDLTKAIEQRLDAEGISIPFPQRDVHIHNAA